MTDDAHIDQKFLDKQSRTIGTYGLETMTKLISFKVLIVGCGGVGVEIAKNLALAGIHTINLYDPRKCTNRDMGVNFAVTRAAVSAGRTMSEASAAYIADLNPNTRVQSVPALSKDVVAGHTAVIFTSAAPDLSVRTLTQWNDFCRGQPKAITFMLALQMGTSLSVFVDNGSNFTVKDADGRPMLQKSVTEVVTLKDKSGKAYTRVRFETPEGQTPGALRDYTQIKFSEVKGLVKADGKSINGVALDGVVCPSDPRDTVRLYPSLESLGYSKYETGGFIHELKEVTHPLFHPLSKALAAPGAFVVVSPMMDNSEESRMHMLTHALLRYANAHDGQLPALHKEADAQAVVAEARKILEENKKAAAAAGEDATGSGFAKPENEEFPFKLPPPPPPRPLVVDELDEAFIKAEALIARAELQPLASFVGAVVAQEVVKITGKYTPICQWFHLSSNAVLNGKTDFSGADYALQGDRYDDLIAIFGKTFQEKLSNLNIFMVGCGALGCENVKNFALCGITCGPKGSLVVTDNDRIEVSNLSRQFLFREENVGQSKSAAAGARMKQINPDARMDARQDFVGSTTEHLFPDTFWSGLDVVVNALDNMEARFYVDEHCVRFHKILVEAGTMGTGGNVDIIVPGKTASYTDGGNADQTGGIPMCTLRNFPYIYDHCIEWARAQFDDVYVSPMRTANQIVEDPAAFVGRINRDIAAASNEGEKRSIIEKNLGPLKALESTLRTLAAGPTMDKCVEMAWHLMFSLFRDRIVDLQKAFPKDAAKKNGEPFWSGHRKYPSELKVDKATLLKNKDAVNFLISASNLFACMFGVHPMKPEARFNDEKNRWMQQYRTETWLSQAVAPLSVPAYQASAVEGLDEDLAADAQAAVPSLDEEQQRLNALLETLTTLAAKCSRTKAAPLEFEKDDDDNFQIDFIAATSNLRAENYIIPTQDRMKVKMVAGKIIPAVATTTSAVTGFALIELFKVLHGADVSALRNGMLDVGTNNYVLFERDAPVVHRTKVVSTYLPEQDYTYKKKVIRVPDGFTKYDMIHIPVGPKTTVKEFAEALAAKLNTMLPEGASYAYEIDGLGVGTGLIWNGMAKHANTNAPLMTVIENQKKVEAGGTLPAPFWKDRTQFCDLAITVTADDGDDSVDEVDVETATVCLDIHH